MPAATRRDYLLLTSIAAALSVGALIFYYHQGAILLYGDAVAHTHIARRVFDSRTPGLFQLGTVWLPLPHLLDIPFIVNERLWQTGLGASIPSMIAFVAGALGIYRLVRGMASAMAAWIATLIYALNPNLLYMQATAMTESLYLAFFIWSAVYFAEFVRDARDDPGRAGKSLTKCGLMVSAAMLVRYDGWFLAAVIGAGAALVVWRLRPFAPQLRRGFVNLILLTSSTAALFLLYNQVAFGNALEFANGPYSARAIQARSKTATMPSYPGENSSRDAALQFLKVSRLNLAEGRPEFLLLNTAFIALLASLYFARRYLNWAVLWAPLPFYVLCIAWGSVPVYHPEWWPFSYYNVRYGLQLLPAIAVFAALGFQFLTNFFRTRYIVAAAALVIAASYYSVWKTAPICLREAQINGKERIALERQLAGILKSLPPSATLMMNCGAHPASTQMAGIRLGRVLCESSSRLWKVALKQPARSADYIVAFAGDEVAGAVHDFPQELETVATIGTPSQPKALIYHSSHR
ncbi:MAG TPA: glycosyltransferase family 39 protein [Candidatus Angelobacter sp.]|nr:glycosyltransferase family 39 protein [Candidatus Angelobacter sp.]